MKRTSVIVSSGALLLVGAALVAPAQASALGGHAPSVEVPKVQHVATAHRATVSDQQQITSAILHSSLLGAVQPSNVAVSQIRFDGADRAWAAALATPKNGQTDPAQVLLQKSGDTWQVRDLGTAGVGCGIAPSAVRGQLGLHGPC